MGVRGSRGAALQEEQLLAEVPLLALSPGMDRNGENRGSPLPFLEPTKISHFSKIVASCD